MSKSKKGFQIEDFGHVNDPLIKKVEAVIADRKGNRYSTSAIYGAHNKVFKLNEVQQNCASCLQLRADKLTKWYEWYGQHIAPKAGTIQMPVTNAGKEGDPEGSAAQATHDLEDGRVLSVLADGSVQIDGSAALEGAYVAKDGTALAVLDGKLITPEPEAQSTDPNAPGYVAPQQIETGQSQPEAKQILLQKIDKDDYTKTEGDPFYAAFTASEADALKGKAVEVEGGKAVKPGTYATEDTAFVLKVSVGGAATYTAVQA